MKTASRANPARRPSASARRPGSYRDRCEQYGYDSRGNGVSTAYGYDGISRLASLTHTMAGGNVQSQAYGLGYNEASQIGALSQSNGLYQWAPSYGAASFDGEFSTLSLWNGTTGAGSTGVWATNYGYGGNSDSVTARTLPGTGEVELYVDPSLTGTGTTALGLNPYSLSGGVLTLHAAPTPAADVASLWGYNFTSGMISSRNTFTQTYGYFEAEMKLPPGQGNWPAFWLYAVNGNSELDVMEEQNGSNVIKGTAHNNGSGGDATYVTNTIANLTAGFHKFGVLWTPTTITWYVDRASIGSVPTPSNLNSPMYMIANLALNSGTPSNYAGGTLEIGYIRAYTLANAPVSNQSLAYSVNGQNQLTSSGGAAIGYDARGNLNSDSVNSYSYDILNRLVSTGAGATTVYDPEDRLLSLTQGGTTTQFAYVGADVATEINGSNQILRRYVPGPAEDEPVVWFEGSDGANPRWLLQDHQGSVVAVTDMTGGALAVNTYSDYGLPGAGNLGRYQFTGQFYLPEVGLYDYKARLYSPTQARFMQTDPVGYGDGLNWYDYVHNDPVNHSDPSGNQWQAAAAAGCAADAETGCLPGAIVAGAAAACAMSPGCRGAVGDLGRAIADGLGGLIHHNDQSPETPNAPPANNGDSKPHGSPEHNEAVDKEVQKMKDQNYGDIRKNQTQVDAQGNKVGNNRPDVQGTNPNTGQREHVEVDRDSNRGAQHEQDIMRNDPSAKCTLLSCP